MDRPSIFEPTVLAGGRKGQQSPRAAYLDMIIGFVGFIAVVAFVVTVVAELSGESAVIQALILLGVVLALVALFRVRRRIN
jgi:hypothetical protein